MKRLSKTQSVRKTQFISALTEAKSALDKVIDAYNATIDREYSKVAAAIVKYNEEVEAFNTWREEVRTDMEEFYDNKSDGWRDGDSGQTYYDWMSQWADDWPEISQEEPDKLVVEFQEDPENLDVNYPDEVG